MLSVEGRRRRVSHSQTPGRVVILALILILASSPGRAENTDSSKRSVAPNGAVAGQTLNPFDLPPGASITIEFDVTVNDPVVPATTTQISNQGSITGSSFPGTILTDDPDTGSADDPTITLLVNADLQVSKSDSPDPVVAGNNITYTIDLTNNGPSDAAGVTVTDAVPANTTFVSAMVTSGTGWSISSPAVGGTGNVVFSKGTVSNSETAQFEIVVNVGAAVAGGATITNDATAASTTIEPNPGNNTGTAATTVSTSADLSVAKSDSPDPVVAGNNITYTIDLSNNGPSDAAGVTVTDAVPTDTTFVSATAPVGWTTTTPAVGGTGNVVFSKTTVASGETAQFQIVVNVNSGTSNGTIITNTATAASSTSEPAPGDNSATETTTVQNQADLAVTKVDDPDPVLAGSDITYTIDFANNGPSPAVNVTLTDATPANTTFVSATAPAGWTTSAPAVGGTGNVVFSKATVVNGETAQFEIIVNVDASTADGSTITNDATAASDTADSNSGNDTGTATTTVQNQADLAVTKVDDPDPVLAGNDITYTIDFVNNGPNDAIGVTVTDATPANTTFVSATVLSGTGWSISSPAPGGTGNVVFSKATVPSGETAQFEIVVNVDTATADGSTINNSATAASSTVDPDSGNDTGTAITSVVNQADLAVTKTDTPDPVVAGNEITYAIDLENFGPNDAINVTITDTTPPNTTFVSATAPAGWTTTSPAVGGTGDVIFSKATVSSGETATFQIVVAVDAATPSGATITNTVAAGSDTLDPNTTDNTATTDTLVVRSGQTVAVDPMGRFVIFADDPGCGEKVLFYQAINAGGNSLGPPRQLTGCGALAGDAVGVDIAEDEGDYWISFGGSQPADGKHLIQIDVAGTTLAGPAPVVDASKFGSVSGATAIVPKGCCKILMYIIGDGGRVYRVVIDKTRFTSRRARDTSILALGRDSLQITQGTAERFLALERPDDVLKGFGLNRRGFWDGSSWRLSPRTDGGHETGGVAPDGLAALSNNADPPTDQLYYQPLNASGLPAGDPKVVVTGAGDITAVDVTSALPGGIRFVVFATDAGVFLQVVDDATGSKLGPAIVIH